MKYFGERETKGSIQNQEEDGEKGELYKEFENIIENTIKNSTLVAYKPNI